MDRKEFNAAVFDTMNFKTLLQDKGHPWVLDALITSIEDIDDQINTWGDTRPGWHKKVTEVRRVMRHRLRQITSVREETRSPEAEYWRNVALVLSDVVSGICENSGLDASEELDFDLSNDGTTVYDWYLDNRGDLVELEDWV